MSFGILYKFLVVFVLALFVGVVFAPSLSVVSKSMDEEFFIPVETVQDDVEKSVSCYVFDRSGSSECEVVLSSDEFSRFYSLFEELNHKISYQPFSSDTKVLKSEFADLVDDLGLIPVGSSREDIVRLMNPSVDLKRKPLLSLIMSPVLKGRGYTFFCNFATLGEGSQFPVIILPRLIPIIQLPIPRVMMHWNAIYGVTSCGGLLSGKGFIAEGAQQGTALGFWGIGFSVFLPPVMSFGFIGYALFSTATAENIIPWPPNRPPVILGEDPPDGTMDVPLGISELSFSLSDYDRDRMNYTVTTSPYIGSDSGNNVKDGDFSFDIFGLDSNTEYTWNIVVSDGEDITEETYMFHTEIEAPIVSNPLPVDGDSWVSVDISELSIRLEDLQGDPMDYSIETSPDIGSVSGSGVGNGVYTLPVDGLEYTQDYTWFVNVTDGKYWVRKVFSFKTQPVMVFDPFDEGWLYRKQITINHSMVAGDLSDFPVLISIIDSDLASKAQVDGDDVLFMAGSGVANRLFHEVELFDDSSGELVCWVNVPSLSSSEDSVLFLYYGNSGCGSQEYPDLVWDSDFIHVWHLGDSLDDSAGFDDGNDHGTSIVSGKVGNARDFEQSENDFIDFGDMDQPGDSSLTTMTWEAWIKPETQDGVIMCKYDSSGTDYASYHISFFDGGKFKLQANSKFDAVGRTRGYTDDSYSEVGKWVYLTGTYNLGSVQDLDAFVNGEEVSFTQDYSNANVMWNAPVTDDLGRYRPESSGPYYVDAVIDELRWSKTVRSDEWINTSYNTMNDPSGFFSVGPEESGP